MKNKKVKITWQDAVFYRGGHEEDKPTDMETIGELEEETEGFVIIKNPKTTKVKTGKPHPENKKPTFYFIPRGMIQKIEELASN